MMEAAPHRVVVLALDGVVPFELGIPKRIFGAARGAGGQYLYRVQTCSPDGRPVSADADYTIQVEHDARLLAQADTVVVPPSHTKRVVAVERLLPPAVDAALRHVRPGTRMVGICTGAFVLAAAGLLDGRHATTHWRQTDLLQRQFPNVKVDPDVLFVDDGDVLTSAGVAAGVDLCLHIVRRDHGSEVANGAAQTCVVPPWRDGGQAQYIRRPIAEPTTASTAATRAWALAHLDQRPSLDDLAARADESAHLHPPFS